MPVHGFKTLTIDDNTLKVIDDIGKIIEYINKNDNTMNLQFYRNANNDINKKYKEVKLNDESNGLLIKYIKDFPKFNYLNL